MHGTPQHLPRQLENSAGPVEPPDEMRFGLPTDLGNVNPRTQTPVVSIDIYATLGFALGAAGRFGELGVMSSVARLLG